MAELTFKSPGVSTKEIDLSGPTSISPTGVPAKGGATRKRRKPSNASIVRRRRSRRYGQLKLK